MRFPKKIHHDNLELGVIKKSCQSLNPLNPYSDDYIWGYTLF